METEKVLELINKDESRKKRIIMIICFILMAFMIGRLSAMPTVDRLDYNYIYSYAIVNNTTELAERITDVVLEYTRKKNVDVRFYTRLLWLESRFIPTAVSYDSRGPLAYGIGQVNMRVWSHKFHYCLDKKYAKMLLRRPESLYNRVAFYIEANIDVSTDILVYYLNMYNWRYDLALTAYNAGQNSAMLKRMRRGVFNSYAMSVLEPIKSGFYDEIKKEGWVYVEKQRLFLCEVK